MVAGPGAPRKPRVPALRYADRMPAREPDPLPATRHTGAFERRVGAVLDAHLAPDQPLLVACSGGADSSAALVAVVRAAQRATPRAVTAAYFDHGMRPAGAVEADRAAVAALAGTLGIAMVHGEQPRVLSAQAVATTGQEAASRPAAIGSEAAARAARYRWLAEACRDAGAAVCVTGHTLDDQAETVLLRLARGTGTDGAAGMAVSAPWPVQPRSAEAADSAETGPRPPLRVLRPLLGITSDRVTAYTAALGLSPREDETNALLVFDRNRIRKRVLPELRRINPRAAQALARFAELARSDAEALGRWAHEEAAEAMERGPGWVAIDRDRLRSLPEAVASRVVRLAAAELDLQLDGGQVQAVLRLLGRRGARIALRGGGALVGETVLELHRGSAAQRPRP